LGSQSGIERGHDFMKAVSATESPLWKKWLLSDIFDIAPSKTYKNVKEHLDGDTPVISNTSSNNGVIGYTSLSANNVANVITFSDTTDSDKTFFYQGSAFVGYAHVQVMQAKGFTLDKRVAAYIITCIVKQISGVYNYGSKFNRETANRLQVTLPTNTEGELDITYMQEHIKKIEAEHIKKIEAYLQVTGYTQEELETISKPPPVKWERFNLKQIFGASQRGRRLKSDDRIPGTLPFVTAGETNTGISDWIGNHVTIYSPGTITIDMFGSAKYRGYEYGADDHISIVDSSAWPKESVMFITASINKVTYQTGEYSYARNFYPKDADATYILLPIREDKIIDHEYMRSYTRWIEASYIKKLIVHTQASLQAFADATS
jgi:Type I restriction modification DNA specificity domain